MGGYVKEDKRRKARSGTAGEDGDADRNLRARGMRRNSGGKEGREGKGMQGREWKGME